MDPENILDKVTLVEKPVNLRDTYEEYKRRYGLEDLGAYAGAVNALYAASKRGLSSYGQNSRKISNKGLQSSGYSAYIDSLSKSKFNTGLDQINDSYQKREADISRGYAGYLEQYADKQTSIKKSVMSHLIKNDVVDLGTAIAYGVSAGLSREDAESVGKSAYEVTKQNQYKQ